MRRNSRVVPNVPKKQNKKRKKTPLLIYHREMKNVMTPWEVSIDAFKVFGAGALSFFGALIPTYWSYNQHQNEQQVEIINRQHEENTVEWYKDILESHTRYADCLLLIYQYKNAHGDHWADNFLNELHSSDNDVKQNAEEVNRCRSQSDGPFSTYFRVHLKPTSNRIIIWTILLLLSALKINPMINVTKTFRIHGKEVFE